MERRGDYLIVGGADSIVRVWKDVGADGCREISTATRTGTNLRGFAVTRDGQWMVTGSSDPASLAKLWKITDGELQFVRDFAGKGAASERITSLAISNDGKKVYGGTDKGVVFVWDAASGEITATLTPSKTPVVQIRTLANDDLLIAADDGSLRKYTGPTLAAGAGAQVDGFVDGLAVSDDDSAAVVIVVPAPKPGSKVADPSGLAIVDLKTMAVRVLATPKTGEPGFRAVRFAPESLTFHTLLEPAGNQPASIATWEAGSDRGAKLAKERAFPVALQAPVAVLSDKSGDLFTIHGHEVYRWDAQSFSMKLSYRPHYQVPQAAFSADGAIVGNCSQSLKLWNAKTGKAIAKLETVHKGPTWSLDFSPRATGAVYHFVTSGSDGLIKQWTWEAGAGFKEVRSLAGHKGAIRSVIYSPDGTQILSTGDDGTARLWSVENGQELRVLSLPKTELNGETVPFVTGRFSPDGQFILVAADRNAYLWSADAAGNAAPLRRLVGHSREVQAVGFLGTGPTMRLVTGSRDRSLRVWDPRLGRVDTMAGIVDARELVEMTRHEEAVTALDVSRKGLLVSVGRDGNVNLWPSEPDTAPQRGDMVRGDAPARTTIAAR
jgi:WD40 repeat protein